MLGNTQPTKTIQNGQKKSWRGLRFLFSVLAFIIILALSGLGAYRSAISTRQANENATLAQQLGDQYQLALVDIQFGKYENARQRLEFIIAHDQTFPGAQQKLTEVLVMMNVPTPTATVPPTTTPDSSGAQQAFAQAQQLMNAQDWPSALAALDTLRKLDPAYNASQVDGMYFFALRNYGYNLITKNGNLEGGIYQFTLAERFGTLDNVANGLREGARYYLVGASFWDLDWQQAVNYFSQVAGGWPSLWDGTMTASDRYRIASMRYGDELLAQERFCDAFTQYDNAQKMGALDDTSDDNLLLATQRCYPATATPGAVITVSPTTDGSVAITDTPAAPTETPVTPTDTPTTP
jgi:tetratricopeptide (TPR) repeat protein